MKQNIKKAKRHLTKLRELVSKRKHPLTEVKEEKVLETLRKTREELWDKKLLLILDSNEFICGFGSPESPPATR
jgi:hypothetical protein